MITYQHFPRENREAYTRRMMNAMETRLSNATAFAIRTPHVLFLIASQQRDAKPIGHALARTFNRDHRAKSRHQFDFDHTFLTGK